jgi:hypothetical protein
VSSAGCRAGQEEARAYAFASGVAGLHLKSRIRQARMAGMGCHTNEIQMGKSALAANGAKGAHHDQRDGSGLLGSSCTKNVT